MQRIVIFTPAVVRARNHLEMLRIQSLLRQRLEQAFADQRIEIFSAVIFDHIAADFFSEAIKLDFNIKLFSAEVARSDFGPYGIRRPVEYFLDKVHWILGGRRDVYLLRIIQDTFLEDVTAFADQIQPLLKRRARKFIAGKIHQCSNISQYASELGLPQKSCYDFIQGALMLADCSVWQTYYPWMPRQINHYCDDSVMSQMLSSDGGELIDLSETWDHRHDCPLELCREIFDKHNQELINAKKTS